MENSCFIKITKHDLSLALDRFLDINVKEKQIELKIIKLEEELKSLDTVVEIDANLSQTNFINRLLTGIDTKTVESILETNGKSIFDLIDVINKHFNKTYTLRSNPAFSYIEKYAPVINRINEINEDIRYYKLVVEKDIKPKIERMKQEIESYIKLPVNEFYFDINSPVAKVYLNHHG